MKRAFWFTKRAFWLVHGSYIYARTGLTAFLFLFLITELFVCFCLQGVEACF